MKDDTSVPGSLTIPAVIHPRQIDAEGNVFEDGAKIGWLPPCAVHAPMSSEPRCWRCGRALPPVVDGGLYKAIGAAMTGDVPEPSVGGETVLSADKRRVLLDLAIEHHKSADGGDGEYGCNGATCPRVQSLHALLVRAASLDDRALRRLI